MFNGSYYENSKEKKCLILQMNIVKPQYSLARVEV